jgi:hypothetical protein
VGSAAKSGWGEKAGNDFWVRKQKFKVKSRKKQQTRVNDMTAARKQIERAN